jgi:hypothetical protein
MGLINGRLTIDFQKVKTGHRPIKIMPVKNDCSIQDIICVSLRLTYCLNYRYIAGIAN